MQQMHQGQIPGPPNPPESAFNNSRGAGGPSGKLQFSPPEPVPKSENATSLDDLVSSAARDAAQAANAVPDSKSGMKVEEAAEDKKGKKEKDKNAKLVYSDNEVSPEEKMAHLPRYAFVPEGKVGA